jgi:hypothetical protein
VDEKVQNDMMDEMDDREKISLCYIYFRLQRGGEGTFRLE